jgi:hypothetical protein
LNVDGTARFLVLDGKKIIIQKENNAEDRDVRLLLFGSAMGALLYQRGWLPLHGCAVKAGDSAYIITGVSGAGKSALTAALLKRGYSVLSDDISPITAGDEGEPMVYPGLPFLMLWADVLEKMKLPPGSGKAWKNSFFRWRPAIARPPCPSGGFSS